MSYQMVVLIVLTAGIFGGVANYVLSTDDKNGGSSDATGLTNPRQLVKSVILGIAASFIVPVFLQVGQSNLIAELVQTIPPDMPSADAAAVESKRFQSLLVLVGFCLVAAISSRQFIESISKKVLQQAQQASEEAAQAKADFEELSESLEEDEIDETETAAPDTPPEQTAQLEPGEQAVLRALAENPLIRRSVTGLNRQTRLDKTQVLESLDSLARARLVEELDSRKKPGQKRYKLTMEGRNRARRLESGNG